MEHRHQWQQRPSSTGSIALLLCTLLLSTAGCGQVQEGPVTASPATGWTTYRDAHYSFHVPLAPGWQVVPQPNDGCDAASDCDYRIAFFPPDGQGRLPVSEQIYIRVVVGANEWKPETDPYFTRDAHDIAIGSTSAPLYVYDAGGWTRHTAVGRSGSRQFLLGVQAPDARAQRDLAIYTQMLRDFSYTASR